MIPAPPGIVARYEHEINGRTLRTQKPVVAFNDDGEALVVGDDRLIPAAHGRSFVDLSDTP